MSNFVNGEQGEWAELINGGQDPALQNKVPFNLNNGLLQTGSSTQQPIEVHIHNDSKKGMGKLGRGALALSLVGIAVGVTYTDDALRHFYPDVHVPKIALPAAVQPAPASLEAKVIPDYTEIQKININCVDVEQTYVAVKGEKSWKAFGLGAGWLGMAHLNKVYPVWYDVCSDNKSLQAQSVITRDGVTHKAKKVVAEVGGFKMHRPAVADQGPEICAPWRAEDSRSERQYKLDVYLEADKADNHPECDDGFHISGAAPSKVSTLISDARLAAEVAVAVSDDARSRFELRNEQRTAEIKQQLEETYNTDNVEVTIDNPSPQDWKTIDQQFLAGIYGLDPSVYSRFEKFEVKTKKDKNWLELKTIEGGKIKVIVSEDSAAAIRKHIQEYQAGVLSPAFADVANNIKSKLNFLPAVRASKLTGDDLFASNNRGTR